MNCEQWNLDLLNATNRDMHNTITKKHRHNDIVASFFLFRG